MIERSSRQKLIEASVALISERGYRETTVGDIEAAAGLTRRAGGFYRHFPSKEDVLVQALREISEAMIAEIDLGEIVSLEAPRAELLLIGRALIRHAETYRPIRLILQLESHRLPALRQAAKEANDRLAALDVVPWVEDVLKRCGVERADARALALIMFGPILAFIISEDRRAAIFGVDESFLVAWANHWSAWLARGGRD